MTYKNDREIRKATQDTFQQIVRLEMWADMIIRYCDVQYRITKDNSTEYMIENISKLYEPVEFVDSPVEVMEHIYGEFIAECAGNQND